MVIYARQSVDKKDSVSIETQIGDCKSKIKTDTVRVYEDKGYSGKNTDIPDFKKLVVDIKAGITKTLIVCKVDRASRNITDFYNVYEILKEYDCDFVSYTENFDTSSIGHTTMGIPTVFAQME